MHQCKQKRCSNTTLCSLDDWICYNVLSLTVLICTWLVMAYWTSLARKHKNWHYKYMLILVCKGTLWRMGPIFMPVLSSFANPEKTFLLIIALTFKFTWGLKSLKFPALVFVSERATFHLDISTAIFCAVGRDTHVWMRMIYAAILKRHNSQIMIVLGMEMQQESISDIQ